MRDPGARAASSKAPRDFYCGCNPAYHDYLPLCEEAKPGCPYAGRLSKQEIEVQDTVKAFIEFMKCFKGAAARAKKCGALTSLAGRS